MGVALLCISRVSLEASTKKALNTWVRNERMYELGKWLLSCILFVLHRVFLLSYEDSEHSENGISQQRNHPHIFFYFSSNSSEVSGYALKHSAQQGSIVENQQSVSRSIHNLKSNKLEELAAKNFHFCMLKSEIQAGCQIREFCSRLFTWMKVGPGLCWETLGSKVNSIHHLSKRLPMLVNLLPFIRLEASPNGISKSMNSN